jgi:2-polyprenyl-3-methyl-5-hydroxy-6-metoxy-1,4-benzoquinol methylase
MEIEYETLHTCIFCDSSDIMEFDAKNLLFICPRCGIIFDNPRPTQSSIEAYYSEKGKYDPWLERGKGMDEQWIRVLKRIRQFKPSGDLLDVGAGIGQFISYARDHFSCEGTEISAEGIELAKKKFNVALRHGELETIDFGTRKFDVICLFHVLEHLPYPGKSLRHCASLLNPDGILYISLPNEGALSLRRLLPGLLSMLGSRKFKGFSTNGFRKIAMDLEEIHLSHFSEPVLKDHLARNSFSIAGCGIDFIDPFMFKKGPVQIIRHLLFAGATVLRAITGINMYNCFWCVAKKTE